MSDRTSSSKTPQSTFHGYSLKGYQNSMHHGHNHVEDAPRSRLALRPERPEPFLPGDRCCPYCDEDERVVGSPLAMLTRIWKPEQRKLPGFVDNVATHVLLDVAVASALLYRGYPTLKPHLKAWGRQMQNDWQSLMGLVGYAQYQVTQSAVQVTNTLTNSITNSLQKSQSRPLHPQYAFVQQRFYNTSARRRNLHLIVPTPDYSTLHGSLDRILDVKVELKPESKPEIKSESEKSNSSRASQMFELWSRLPLETFSFPLTPQQLTLINSTASKASATKMPKSEVITQWINLKPQLFAKMSHLNPRDSERVYMILMQAFCDAGKVYWQMAKPQDRKTAKILYLSLFDHYLKSDEITLGYQTFKDLYTIDANLPDRTMWVEMLQKWHAAQNLDKVVELISLRTQPGVLKELDSEFATMAIVALDKGGEIDLALAMYADLRRQWNPRNGRKQADLLSLLTPEALNLYKKLYPSREWFGRRTKASVNHQIYATLLNRLFDSKSPLASFILDDAEALGVTQQKEFIMELVLRQESLERLREIPLTELSHHSKLIARYLDLFNQAGDAQHVLDLLLQWCEIKGGLSNEALVHLQVPWLNALAWLKDWTRYQQVLELLKCRDITLHPLSVLSFVRVSMEQHGVKKTMDTIVVHLKHELDRAGMVVGSRNVDDSLIALLNNQAIENDNSDTDTLVEDVETLEWPLKFLTYPSLTALVHTYSNSQPPLLDRYPLLVVCAYLHGVKGVNLAHDVRLSNSLLRHAENDLAWKQRLFSALK